MSQPSPQPATPQPGGKGGLYQRGKDRTMARATPIVATAAGPAEQILAGARVESGISRWWLLLSSYAAFLRKYYFIVLTGHYVVLIRNSRWSGRPRQAESVIPREQVRVSDWKPGVVFGSFRYADPGRAKPMTMRVHRIYRPEIEFMLSQLGAFAPGYLAGAPGLPPGSWPGGPGGQPYAPEQAWPPPPGPQPGWAPPPGPGWTPSSPPAPQPGWTSPPQQPSWTSPPQQPSWTPPPPPGPQPGWVPPPPPPQPDWMPPSGPPPGQLSLRSWESDQCPDIIRSGHRRGIGHVGHAEASQPGPGRRVLPARLVAAGHLPGRPGPCGA